jgi:predicted enzyme related to lactoylglutathione lyase
MNIQDRIGKSYWFDLPVIDPVNGRSFYEGLFNWKFLLMNDSALSDYWVIQSGEELIGGLRQTSTPIAKDSSAPVLYFTVNDVETSAKRVKELGGKLVGEKVDLGKGRGAYQLFRDREGNLAALWAPSKE